MSALRARACGCLSGLTSRQAVFLELAGQLEALAWKVCEVRAAHELRDEDGDAEVIDRMLRTQAALVRMTDYCRAKGWRK